MPKSNFKKEVFNLGIEFGPIITFIVLAEFIDFITATIVFVFLTGLTLIIAFYARRKFALFPFIVAISIIAFGVMTIVNRDPSFIILKDTLYNGFAAIAVVVSLYLKKPLLKLLFEDTFSMNDTGWRVLTKRWGFMFAILAISNEIVRHELTADEWVVYKAFVTITTAAFGFYQLTLAKKYRLPEASPWGMRI